jgi:hypothetical protein
VPTTTPPPAFDPKHWLKDPILADKVGRSMSHALKIFGLGLGASETKAKI